MSDLKKKEKSLRADLEMLKRKSVSGAALEAVSRDLMSVQKDIENFSDSQPEIVEDFQRLKVDTSDHFKIISREMRDIEVDVKELKDLVSATFSLIVDQRYKDGIESIEAAYQTFLDGANNNLEETLASFDYYIVEMQTNFNQHLKPSKIDEYFKQILRQHGPEMCREMFDYILVVKGKYLQMMTVYYIFKKDFSRVQTNFERFNEHYFELKERLEKTLAAQSSYKEITEDRESSISTTTEKESLQLSGLFYRNTLFSGKNISI